MGRQKDQGSVACLANHNSCQMTKKFAPIQHFGGTRQGHAQNTGGYNGWLLHTYLKYFVFAGAMVPFQDSAEHQYPDWVTK